MGLCSSCKRSAGRRSFHCTSEVALKLLHRDGLLVFETGQRASLRCARLRRWMAFALPSAPLPRSFCTLSSLVFTDGGTHPSSMATRCATIRDASRYSYGCLLPAAGYSIALVCLAAGDQRLELLLRRGQPPGRPIAHGLARPPVLCLQRNPVDLRACAHVPPKAGQANAARLPASRTRLQACRAPRACQ